MRAEARPGAGAAADATLFSWLSGGLPWWKALLVVGAFACMIPPWAARMPSNAGLTMATLVGLVLLIPVFVDRSTPRVVHVMALALLLWLALSIATASVNGSDLRWSIFHSVRPLIVVADLAFLVWLLRVPRRWPLAIVAVLLGSCIAGTIGLYSYTVGQPDLWRFAFGPSLSPLIVVVAAIQWHRGRRAWALALLVLIVSVNVAAGLRSVLLQCAVAAAAALVFGIAQRLRFRWPLIATSLGMVLIVLSVIPVYGAVAESGALGRQQQEKWRLQSDVAGGIILGGRPEFTLALNVLPLVPVLGLGFDPTIPANIAEARDARAIQHVMTDIDRVVSRTDPKYPSYVADSSTKLLAYWARPSHGIYLHSGVFQYWLWCGPLVVVPFALVLMAGLMLVGRASRRYGAAGVLGASALLTKFTWDTLFSPLGGGGLALMALIVALLAADTIARKEQPAQQPAADGDFHVGGLVSASHGDGARRGADRATEQS
ncbi:unannotated protein [freshwater metagenome]|uniref:Unannotated protein n=1 Tax=freshwater metagenome TaxID=449393 RepID=A0A6J7JIS5_9ZZZZ